MVFVARQQCSKKSNSTCVITVFFKRMLLYHKTIKPLAPHVSAFLKMFSCKPAEENLSNLLPVGLFFILLITSFLIYLQIKPSTSFKSTFSVLMLLSTRDMTLICTKKLEPLQKRRRSPSSCSESERGTFWWSSWVHGFFLYCWDVKKHPAFLFLFSLNFFSLLRQKNNCFHQVNI